MVFTFVFPTNWLSFARALNGDYMTLDGKITCDQPPMTRRCR